MGLILGMGMKRVIRVLKEWFIEDYESFMENNPHLSRRLIFRVASFIMPPIIWLVIIFAILNALYEWVVG